MKAFFNDWLWTYDPRRAGGGQSPLMPFDLWPKQAEYLDWLEAREANKDEAVVEKSRDVGATNLCAGFAVHRWLFVQGYKTTFGSRTEDLVDKLGDPDTIFEKIRTFLIMIPPWMMPKGWDQSRHGLYKRLINPENGNIIAGEGGKNMGRGGRSTMYFVDEAAHIEHAGSVEKAVVANSDVRIWISSVNGMGNLFAKKRHSGRYPVFTFDWSDDPRKDVEWYKRQKASMDEHVWAQEYGRDYAASVEGACIPGAWVQSARALYDAGLVEPSKVGTAGLDVGGGGAGKSVAVVRHGPVCDQMDEWSTGDNITMAHEALSTAKEQGAAQFNFDNIGVGDTVTNTFLHAENIGDITINGINVGMPPTDTIWPDKKRSFEKFLNLKMELWWTARAAFQRSHERWLYEMEEKDGIDHPLHTCIALANLPELVAELSIPRVFRTEKGMMQLESKKQLAIRGIASPDHAEAFILTYVPPITTEPGFRIS